MPDLSSNSKKFLLKTARQSIENHFKDVILHESAAEPDDLRAHFGCFVTLRKNRILRGCVGTFEASRSLLDNVKRMSVAAAFQDRRFPPVEKNEIPDIQLEISVLGNLEKIQVLDEIELGRHGVYVKLGDKTGTFLPDVALEQRWNVVEFVTYCAREKAGLLPEECARAEVFRYPVDKISE